MHRAFRLRSQHLHTQTEFTKKIDLNRSSKVLQRKYSVATSVASDDSKVKKDGKRLSKDVRRAMVESYVTRYKAMNNGKFPTASDTMKQVGGSYYVVKGILQEIQCQSKTSIINPMLKNALEKEATDVNRASADVAAGLESRQKQKAFPGNAVEPMKTVDVDDVDSDYTDVKSFAAEERPTTSTLVKPIFSDHIVEAPIKLKTTNDDAGDLGASKCMDVSEREEPIASSSLKKTSAEEVVQQKNEVDSSSCSPMQEHELKVEPQQVITHIHPENSEPDVKEKSPSEGQHPQMPQPKSFAESDKLAMSSQEKQTDNEELPRQKSIWKSLADGIMKIWRS